MIAPGRVLFVRHAASVRKFMKPRFASCRTGNRRIHASGRPAALSLPADGCGPEMATRWETRSGNSIATRQAAMAPMSCPTMAPRFTPSASKIPMASPARRSRRYASFSFGLPDWPNPRWSTVTTRQPASCRGRTWWRHA